MLDLPTQRAMFRTPESEEKSSVYFDIKAIWSIFLSVCYSRKILGPKIIMKWLDMTSPLMYYMFQDISGCLQYK